MSENTLLTLGTLALAVDHFDRPDYDLTCRVVRLIEKNRSQLRPDGRLKICYPNADKTGIFAPYQHEIKAGTTEGVLMFVSAAYLDDGGYCDVYGVEGEDWRLLTIGCENDVRRRFLVGNAAGFQAWADSLIARGALPIIEQGHHLEHDVHMRLRCGVAANHKVDDLTKALEGSLGDWMIVDNRPYNLHIELEREEDVALLPQTTFIIGTNWQASMPDLLARREATSRPLKTLAAPA